MGSKPADQKTASSASAGAQAADAALAAQANQNAQFSKQARDKLFGPDLSGGTLSGFLDPKTLNVDHPTGTYGLQYNKAIENIANQGAQTRGSLSRYNASRGFGNAPSGFAEDQLRRSESDQVDQQGNAFTDFAGKSYQDALGKFWQATGALQGEGTNALSSAIQGDTAAANNYASLYGTGIQPRPNPLGAIVGGGLQAGGTVGAAAMCPHEDANILMLDGSEKSAKEVRKGEAFKGVDGRACPVLEDPEIVEADCVLVETSRTYHKCSDTHTFILKHGGYEFAKDAERKVVTFGEPQHDCEPIDSVKSIGKQRVCVFKIGGSHSYRADGLWSLS